MRTTLSLDDGLLNEAKARAKRQKTSVGAVVNEALRVGLFFGNTKSSGNPSRALKTFGGDGVQAGVDLHDTAGLLERMDAR